ncbi:uncharacterized protein EAE97_006865 [Botrytis byssoidea]|uniref:AB hydrolase-1 domain-containing protein n=1 Tax=Botrytis byssoidea TaxID=139641 RepID=A0A9P5IM08_9HELO|nr:uncharacterized protein EAE97_006865 [Botrytis byssoidea]KAF7940679.1 hypothetical protein EAE97_006865 [Botrytis byssoidea]
MAVSLPTIVLVHGAWHTPANYKSYSDALEAQGFKVLCPQLPSCNGKSPPVSSFTEDVTAVRNVVKFLVEADERVLMAMHSYGGAVGTDAVEGLTFADRKAERKSGGVIHLFYMCAYVVVPGTSVWDICQEAGFAQLWPQFIQNFDDGSTFPVDPSLSFLGGVEQNIVEKALPNLVRSPMSAFETKTKGDAWRRVPVTPYQDLMLEKVKSEGVVIKTEDYETCHSVFITKEKEMVDAVVVAAKDERNLI